MPSEGTICRWKEGPVDPLKEHLLLTCAPHAGADWDEYFPVARIGPPARNVAQVEILVDRTAPQTSAAVEKVVREISYYLIERQEEDAWGYACYHCGTMSNACSQVHWAHIVPGQDGRS